MADVDTNYLAGQHADIRREAAEHRATIQLENMKGFDRVNADVLRGTNEIVKEGLKESFNIRGDVKDARYDIGERVGNQGDRVTDRLVEHDAKVAARFFDIGRDTQDIRAQIISAQQAMVTGFLGVTKDTEIQALKNQAELAKQTTYLSDKISHENEKTRDLINDLKYHDLNRGLVERNTELVNSEQDRRHYRDRWDDARFNQIQAGFQGQWAQLQSQIQAFQSQLQETRQGMVNFGTMAGVGQSSTSNNVR
jgi:hypothetical protein